MPLTRRSLLTALSAVLVAAPAGCTVFDDNSATTRATPSPRPPDPLLPLLAAESVLLAQFDATLARYPQLTGRLGAVRADHAAHLAALLGIVRNPLGSPSPAATSSVSPPAAAVPATAAAAVATLRAAEVAAARRATAACLVAPPARVALLGSIAACESAHLVLVR